MGVGDTRVGVSERTAADDGSDSLAGWSVVTHPNLAEGPVTGQTLESILEGSRLPTKQVAVIGIGILAGLRALHRAGAGHANLEPAAVLVAPDGQARLVPYGAGKNLPAAEIMAAGRVICTALGVRPDGKAALTDRSRARLVMAARLIAGGRSWVQRDQRVDDLRRRCRANESGHLDRANGGRH